jgi:aminoglycoside 3-N-acetyltransferase
MPLVTTACCMKYCGTGPRVRSDHPDAGVVALGTTAEWITSDHPFAYGYVPGSPGDKMVRANGRVLMLGAPLDTITVLHYTEHTADIPAWRILLYRRRMPGEND